MSDGTSSAFGASEIPNQVTATRAAGATGNIMYNTTSLFARGSEVSRALTASVYTTPAVPPATPWLDAAPPNAPTVVVVEGTGTSTTRVWQVRITPGAGEAARWWVVQPRVAGTWAGPILATADSLTVTVGAAGQGSAARVDAVAVRAADNVWNLSDAAYWRAPSIVAARRE